MAYCTVSDLLIGDIPTSVALSPQKYVNDAADEIDSQIGFVYQTPIDVTSTGAPRPVALLLKRINAHLASGRLILAATITTEDERLNAYGRYLVNTAMASIEAIATGQVILDGVAPGGMTLPKSPMPMILNGDDESIVDAFYDRVVNPNYRPLSWYNPRI